MKEKSLMNVEINLNILIMIMLNYYFFFCWRGSAGQTHRHTATGVEWAGLGRRARAKRRRRRRRTKEGIVLLYYFFVSFSWFFQCNSGAVSVQHQINFFFPNLHLLSVFIEFFSSSSSSSSFSSSSSSSSSSSCRFLLSSALGYWLTVTVEVSTSLRAGDVDGVDDADDSASLGGVSFKSTAPFNLISSAVDVAEAAAAAAATWWAW